MYVSTLYLLTFVLIATGVALAEDKNLSPGLYGVRPLLWTV